MPNERPPRRVPVVPDWAVLAAPAARRAVEGILAAGHYDSRFGGLDAEAASVLAHTLRLYASLARAPAVRELAMDAAMPEARVSEHLAGLCRRDLVLLDVSREKIVGAYPFTEARTGHSIAFGRTGRSLATMCAIDALGAGAMCRADVTIHSACGECGGAVIAGTSDHGMTLKEIRPAEAVVWVGLRPSCGCAANTLCTELLFFCGDRHLARWRGSRGGSQGHRLSPEEAFQVGKALFIDRALMEEIERPAA